MGFTAVIKRGLPRRRTTVPWSCDGSLGLVDCPALPFTIWGYSDRLLKACSIHLSAIARRPGFVGTFNSMSRCGADTGGTFPSTPVCTARSIPHRRRDPATTPHLPKLKYPIAQKLSVSQLV